MKSTPDTPERKDEYEAATEILQYTGNLKLGEVTACIAITGGLLTVFFSVDKPSAQFYIAVLGLLVSLCFFIIYESTQYAWFHFARRAASLEPELGYELWSKLPGAPMFSIRPSLWALRLFYVLVVAFWLATIFFPGAIVGVRPSGGATPAP